SRRGLPPAARPVLGPGGGGEPLAAVQFHWWRRWDVPPARHAWLHDAALCGSLHLEHYAPQSIPEKRSEIERRLRAALPFEEPVEIALCLETPAWLLGIEAVYRSNLRRHTAFDARRERVLRLLAAGTWAASGGAFFS